MHHPLRTTVSRHGLLKGLDDQIGALGIVDTIVNAKKSKYYDAAVGNFERARVCYAAAGQVAKWEALAEEVRREHGRKYSFMQGFERLAEGGPADEPRPSFLERARSRWPRGGR